MGEITGGNNNGRHHCKWLHREKLQETCWGNVDGSYWGDILWGKTQLETLQGVTLSWELVGDIDGRHWCGATTMGNAIVGRHQGLWLWKRQWCKSGSMRQQGKNTWLLASFLQENHWHTCYNASNFLWKIMSFYKHIFHSDDNVDDISEVSKKHDQNL